MTFQYIEGTNEALFRSPADWISPSREGGYATDPPPADGAKVILSDTDYLGGLAGNQQWVWKSFLRGLNFIFMDLYDGAVLGNPFDARWEPIRVTMGYVRRPRGELSSTRYCLTDATASRPDSAKQYLVYLPDSGGATLNLSAAKGILAVEWFNPSTGTTTASADVESGREVEFRAPFSRDAVLHVWARGWQPHRYRSRTALSKSTARNKMRGGIVGHPIVKNDVIRRREKPRSYRLSSGENELSDPCCSHDATSLRTAV